LPDRKPEQLKTPERIAKDIREYALLIKRAKRLLD